MKTLALGPSYPVDMRPIAPVISGGVGQGAISLRRRWERPQYEFELRFPFDSKEEAEALFGLHAYLQGDTPFWFDGGENGDIESPIFVGFGDGAKTQYFLPNRNVFASSLVVYVNGAVEPAWTLTESSGLVAFTTAPAAGAEITAKYRCKFKCIFLYDSEAMYTQSETYFKTYAEGEIRLREIP